MLEVVSRPSQIIVVSGSAAHQSICCVTGLADSFSFYIILNYMVKFLVPSNLPLSETAIVVLSSIPCFTDFCQWWSGTYIPLRFWVWLLLHRCCLSQQLVQMFSVWWMSAIVKNSKMVISSSRNKCIYVKFL